MTEISTDVIIVGTGLTESILAGALSRHKRVLHLDSNSHYGDQHGTLSLLDLLEVEGVKSVYYNDTEIIDIDSNSALWSDCNFLKHIRQNNRKFNIDKSPKVLFSKGPIIDLIIHSGAGPALEFQLISDSFIYYNDNIEKVPKSKEDVFQDDSISLIDKRRLMKFFNFVLEFDPSGETKNQLFWDHLISLKINPKLATIIISSIALKLNVSDLQTISLKTGIEAMKQHLNSFGRFGSGALLTANYGTGSELCQAFCRYCAVYGGEYILDLDLKSIKINSENVVVSDGSTTYTAKSIIIGANFAGILENVQINESKIHRLVCISDKPFLNDGEHVMLIIPAQCSQVDPSLDNKSEKDGAVAIQYNSNNQSCPEDTYILELWCKAEHNSMDDLNLIATKLNKGNMLLCSFTQKTATVDEQFITDNVAVVSGITSCVDAENSVNEANLLFEKLAPNCEFYPAKAVEEDSD